MKRLSAILVLFVPALASAQPARDPAAAEALFKKGVELLEKDDWAGACPSFEASVKLDPSVGAQLNVARCAEHDKKLARAWAEYQRAKVMNRETVGEKRKKEVDAFVEDALKKLEPRLPWVTLRLASRPSGVRIQRDGVEIPIEGLDRAVPVDPGSHVFVATAPGHDEARRTLDAAEGSRSEIVLELRPSAASAPAAPLDLSASAPVAGSPSRDAETSSGVDLVVVGAAIGSVGAASLAVAAITGGLAASDNGTLEDLEGCSRSGETLSCSPAAFDEADAAASRGETLSVTSTVTLFAGAAIAATGLTLVIVGATQSSSGPAALGTPTVGLVPLASPEGAGFRVSGRF